MHLPTKYLNQWVHGSWEKWEVYVGESSQFLETHTRISWNFLLFTLPQCIYHKHFRTNRCTVCKIWSNQFLLCFTLHVAQCWKKNICHELILRPNWDIQKGNIVLLPFLPLHVFRIHLWWWKRVFLQKYQILS